MMKNISSSTIKVSESYPSTKNNIDTCIQCFSRIALSSPKAMFPKSTKQIREDLIQYSKLGQITENFIRPTAWRLFLNVFPHKEEDILKSWITSIKEQRSNYKSKTKTYLSLKKLSGDPLGGVKEKDSGWNSFFEESEIKKQINLDVNRTFQEKELFTTQLIKEIMHNVLFIWSKENPHPGYKQGMNELLATLIHSLYPFYFKNPFDKEEMNKNLEVYLTEQKNYQKELYYYFHDEAEFQSDLYALFTNLMKCGLTYFFDNPNPKDKDKIIEGHETYLQKRCNDMIHEKLRLYNKALYDHFVHIDISCQVFLQRWLKCLFNREFPPKDVEMLWDSILAYEQKEEMNELQMVDYISVAMIVNIQDELMRQDQNECFQRLFTYPHIDSAYILIKSAFTIEEEVKKRKIAEEKALIEKKEKEKREKEERERREKEEREERERHEKEEKERERERKEKEKKEKEEKERKEKEEKEKEKKEKEKEEQLKKQTLAANTAPQTTTSNSLFTPLDIMPSSSMKPLPAKKEPAPMFANISKTVAKEAKSNPLSNPYTNTNTNITTSINTNKPTTTDSMNNEQFFNKNFNQLSSKELLEKLQVIINRYKNQMNANDALNIDIIVDALKVKSDK